MSPKRPVEPAGAVDAPNAPTAPWKTHRTRFPQLPQASKSVTYVLTSQVLPMSWRRALKAGRHTKVAGGHSLSGHFFGGTLSITGP
jgi:hypothetical protein